MRWLVLFFTSVALPAQESPTKKAPPRDAPSAAATPRQLTLPVPEAPPLDLALATKAAIAATLALQEGEGGDQWPYQGVYREDASPSPVGYRVGGTAIACLGLLAAPGYRSDPDRTDAVKRGLTFVLATLDHERMQADFIGTYDVRGWGHIYALQFFLSVQDAQLVPEPLQEAVAAKTKWLVETLVASAIPESGGWNYSRPLGYLNAQNRASTFMTAPALQVLFYAKARGHAVPDQVVTQGLDALERARAKPGGYAYGATGKSQAEVEEGGLTMMDKTPSSAARAAVCETTLALAGRGDAQRLQRAVDLFFAHWDDLAVRKSQPRTHIMPYGMAPYYFLFGHVYCAQAIEQIDDAEKKASLREKMRAVLAKSREADGSWNDRQFGRSGGYGTGLALLTLYMQHVPKPLAWMPSAAKK